MIQSLMENEERLVMVIVSSPSSLHLITPYSSKTLYVLLYEVNHSVDES